MNDRNTLLSVVVGGLAVLLAYAVQHQVKTARAAEGLPSKHEVNPGRAHRRVAKTVAGTLKEHEGEESAVVQAFQQALQADKA